jgi:hypothetical protein
MGLEAAEKVAVALRPNLRAAATVDSALNAVTTKAAATTARTRYGWKV